MFGITSDEKKEIANAYQTMMNMPAWKDLMMYALSERDASFRREDSKSASDLNLPYFCEERGIRKGILKLVQYAEQRKEGI